jgi:glutathione S-transferase
MIELYHWRPVSHSAKVLICLHEIGVEFVSRYVDLTGFEQFSEEFLALNPMGQVPVLKVGGDVLLESSLINEYLAESHPEAGLAPADPLGWYGVQTWAKYVDYNLSPSLATLGCRQHLAPHLQKRDREALLRRIDAIPVEERKAGWLQAATGEIGDDAVENSRRKTRLVVERMEGVLAESAWLAGDAYSIADIGTYAMLVSLADLAPDIVNGDVFPRTMAWLERVGSRPAVQAALAESGEEKLFAPGPEHSRWG